MLMRFFPISLLAVSWLVALTWCSPMPVQALNPVVTQLLPRGGGDRAANLFGRAVSVSDRFILVGEPGDDTRANDAGAVYVYHATTGRFLRKLTAADGAEEDDFGFSVALSGNLALIGAPGVDDTGPDAGAAYLFDVATGRQLSKRIAPEVTAAQFGTSVALIGRVELVGSPSADSSQGAVYVFSPGGSPAMRKLVAAGRDNSDFFGEAISVSGRLVAVGASGDDDVEPDAGAVYVFDWETGVQLRKFTDSGAVQGDHLGVAVAMDGGTLLASSVGVGTGLRGAVYVFDVTTGDWEGTLIPDDAADNDQFGTRIALEGNLAIIGTPFKSNRAAPGVVYAFDVAQRRQVAKWSAVGGVAGDDFGFSVAIGANRVVIGAISDPVNGPLSGAAHLYRPISGPLAMPAIAASRDFAPGVIEGDYARFFEAFVNEAGEALFRASLVGPGAARGKNQALFHTLGTGQTVALAAQRGMTDLGGGAVATRLTTPILNRADRGIFEAILRGAGINGRNNRAVYQVREGEAPQKLFGTGEPIPQLGGGALRRWFDLTQDRTDGAARAGVSYQMFPGIGGITRTEDSGVFQIFDSGDISRWREGQSDVVDTRSGGVVPVGDPLGQFIPRLAMPGDTMVHFPAFLQSDPAGNQGLFRAFNEPDLMARKGGAAPEQDLPQLTTGDYRSFLAETSRDDHPFFRATLQGPEVNGRNNEALFSALRSDFPNLENIARKGLEPDGANEPGVVHRRFLQFWPAGPRALYLAKLGGRGVNARNDCALYLSQEDGSRLRLLREGDAVPGSDGARVGTILRIHGDHVNGHYAILTTLVGGKPGANLALWTGHAGAGNATTQRALRLPTLQLRKGTAYQRITGETVIVKSFSFPNTADRGGAGGKGNGQVINQEGIVALCLEFTNRGKEVLVGKP